MLTDTDKGYLYVILEYLDGGQIMKWDTKKMAYSVPMKDNKGQEQQPSTSTSTHASAALLLPQTRDNDAGGSEEMAAGDGKKVMVYSEHAAKHILVHVRRQDEASGHTCSGLTSGCVGVGVVVCVQVVCGLMYLRRVGVVHKDIKPENVILTKSIAHATGKSVNPPTTTHPHIALPPSSPHHPRRRPRADAPL